MKALQSLVVAVTLGGVAAVAMAGDPDPTDPASFQLIYQGTWIQPAESTIANDAEGDKIRFGRTLLNETYKYLGGGSQSPVQYSGNKQACTNCHLVDGTKPNSGPWITSYREYAAPGKYSSRSDEYRTLEIRINGCMQRSMAGSQIPENSYEMESMVAYFKWLDRASRSPTGKTYWAKVFRRFLICPVRPIRSGGKRFTMIRVMAVMVKTARASGKTVRRNSNTRRYGDPTALTMGPA